MVECKHCGRLVDESKIRQAYMNGELVDVCDDCINEHFEVCSDCGDYFLKSEMREVDDGEYVCEDCYDNNWAECADCGSIHRIDDMRWAEGIDGYICDTCFNDNYEVCEDCGEVHSRDDMTYINDGFGYYVCNRCYGNGDYSYCSNCGDYHHIDNLTYDDDTDEYYCSDCWEEHCENNNGIMEYHGNHGHWDFYKLPEENSDVLYIGHELEVEPKNWEYNMKEAIASARDNLNCYLTHDGSLNEDGFEIVSQPQSYNYLIAHYEDYKRAFEGLVNAGYVSHNSENCGLHFHFTAPYESGTEERENVLSRLWLIVETYKEQFEKISRRAGSFRWCQFLSGSSSNSNHSMIQGMYKMKQVNKNGDRYLVINNRNEKTIELRLFKGTLNIDTFYADLQFAHNLFTLAYNLELPITEIDWAKLTEGEYISKYCVEHNIITDRKITDNSLKYITAENKILRLAKNIYNEYNMGLKKYINNTNFTTKEFSWEYLRNFRNKYYILDEKGGWLCNLISSIEHKNINEAMYYAKCLLTENIVPEIDNEIAKDKMLKKLDKMKKHLKILAD